MNVWCRIQSNRGQSQLFQSQIISQIAFPDFPRFPQISPDFPRFSHLGKWNILGNFPRNLGEIVVDHGLLDIRVCLFKLLRLARFSFIHQMWRRLRRKRVQSSDSDGVGSIPAILNAQNVPLLLCSERFNEASFPEEGTQVSCNDQWITVRFKPKTLGTKVERLSTV